MILGTAGRGGDSGCAQWDAMLNTYEAGRKLMRALPVSRSEALLVFDIAHSAMTEKFGSGNQGNPSKHLVVHLPVIEHGVHHIFSFLVVEKHDEKWIERVFHDQMFRIEASHRFGETGHS